MTNNHHPFQIAKAANGDGVWAECEEVAMGV